MSSYPHTRALGLEVVEREVPGSRWGEGRAGGWTNESLVRASDLEKLLSEGFHATGVCTEDMGWTFKTGDLKTKYVDTHEALILNVRPKKRDTAEGLLREVLDCKYRTELINSQSWCDRARKLLEGK